jgi:hypothetical protein
MLSAEVLWTGEVVAEGSTSEESDWVEVTWSPVPVGPDLKYGFPRMPISGDSFMTLCGALRLAFEASGSIPRQIDTHNTHRV